MPVVEQGRLVGIISIGDVVKAPARPVQGEVDTLQFQSSESQESRRPRLMTRPGTTAPLRVAIVGAGPTGYYAADHLFRQPGLVVDIDMYDRVPTPYGLVRAGVAPDHQKIKSVTASFDKVAANPRFRFFGCVELGRHVSVEDLRTHYHMVLYTTVRGQTDRRMGIPGEDLKTASGHGVSWPGTRASRYRELTLRPLARSAADIVGVGNACRRRRPHPVAQAGGAGDDRHRRLRAGGLRARAASGRLYCWPARGRRRRVHNPEVKELGELADPTWPRCRRRSSSDDLSRAAMERAGDRATQRKVDCAGVRRRTPSGKRRRLILRFLVSRVEISTAAGARRGHCARCETGSTPPITGTLQPKPNRRVRGSAGRPSSSARSATRRAAAGRAVQRPRGSHPQREGTGPRSREQAGGPSASTPPAGSSAARPASSGRTSRTRRRR